MKNQNMAHQNTNNVIRMINIISFLDLLGIGLTMPLYSTYLQSLGASLTVIGILNSVYAGTQVIAGPIIGGWSDIKSKKFVLTCVVIICSISYGIMGFTKSLTGMFILRLILGVFKHIQSICKSIISDIVPSHEQTSVFGRSAALSSLGFMIGPFVAGHLFELSNGFTITCLLTSGIFLLNLVFIWNIPNDLVNKKRREINTQGSTLTKFRQEFQTTISDLRSIDWKVHWEIFLLRFLFGLAMTNYFSNQSIYLKEKYQLSQKHVGYFISFFSGFGSFSGYFLNIIKHYYKQDANGLQRLLHFFTLMAFSVLGIYLSPNIYTLLCLMIPFSLSCTLIRVVSMEVMLKKASEAHTGSFSGASNSIMSVARFITPLFTGILGDLFGEQSVILLSIIPATLGAITCIHLQM